ncbi:MAG TPA: glycosyltransferase [Bacteroidales bacterium]|nr:glycosyltransferase [Bacteroidales bacterium]
MKVLLINNCHFRRGGADVVYLNTGMLLEEYGHDVAYFSTNSVHNIHSGYSGYFVDDVDALQLGFLKQLLNMPRKLYSVQAAKNLERLLKDFKPDIAHIHLYKGGLTASILPVLRKFRIPVALTLHDYSLLCPRNIFVDGDGNLCERCLFGTTFNCVIHRCNRKNIFYSTVNYIEYIINNVFFKPEKYFDQIICVCKFNLEKHLTRPKIRERLVLLYNFFYDQKGIVPLHEKGDYYLFYGRLKSIKGVVTLIDAWERLSDKNLKLKIAGDGNLFNYLENRLKNRNITNIELLGHKTGDELEQLIKNSSFVIVPSECYENNPMTIIEGYSFGKPVIATHLGGIPELIEEGKTGFSFEMRNIEGLKNLIEFTSRLSDDEYRTMSLNARQFVEEYYAKEVHYEKLLNIYKETVAGYEK